MSETLTSIFEVPGGKTTVFQLLQLKAAVKLEKLGMKHSSGKSARKHAALLLGMKPLTPHDEIIRAIEEIIT